ncbi:MAG TPA: aspartyl protease family protein [Myxococcaceae bacterium]|nr:aspartyl protease family protein [Myxococcaceae bacterium]
MSSIPCYQHPEKTARGTCSSCLRAICEVCSMFDGMEEVCPGCLLTRRGKRGARSMVLLGAALFLASLGAMYLGYLWRTGGRGAYSPQGLIDYGKKTDEINRLKAQIAAEPCDRRKIVELGDTLVQVGDYRGALNGNEAFFQKCGPYSRLLWVSYGAHKSLSEFDAAAADATRLIEEDPGDKDYWWWRGLAYEEKGDFEKAAADYRQAITLEPLLRSIPVNLVNMYERSGKPCEALLALEEYFLRYPKLRQEARLKTLEDRLEAAGCDELAGKGKAVVAFSPSSDAIVAMVRINEREKARMVVDTGATAVTLSRRLASRLGLPEDAGASIFVRTAGGIRPARLTVVDQIDLQGARARHVEVAVVDTLPDGVDGLLGLSFLSRFEMTLRPGDGRLEIAERRP